MAASSRRRTPTPSWFRNRNASFQSEFWTPVTRDRPVSGNTGDFSTQFAPQQLQHLRTTGRMSTLGKDSVAASAAVQVPAAVRW